MLMMLGVCAGGRVSVCAGWSGKEFSAHAHDAGCLFWWLGNRVSS